MQPTVGRIVHYVLSEGDEQLLHGRHAAELGRTLNAPHRGQTYAAMIVNVFPGAACANLQVFLDGGATYWATSRSQASDEQLEGRWSWPPRA